MVYLTVIFLFFSVLQQNSMFLLWRATLKSWWRSEHAFFFYIDPEFLDDPAMDGVNSITLSYTFFKTDEEDVEEEDKKAAAAAETKQQQKQQVAAA